MTTLIVTLLVLVAIGFVSWRAIQGLDGEQKRAIKDRAVGVFDWAEARGYFRRAPAFESDYHAEYPELRLLENDYATVRKECQELLGMKERITDVEALGGGYTRRFSSGSPTSTPRSSPSSSRTNTSHRTSATTRASSAITWV